MAQPRYETRRDAADVLALGLLEEKVHRLEDILLHGNGTMSMSAMSRAIIDLQRDTIDLQKERLARALDDKERHARRQTVRNSLLVSIIGGLILLLVGMGFKYLGWKL